FSIQFEETEDYNTGMLRKQYFCSGILFNFSIQFEETEDYNIGMLRKQYFCSGILFNFSIQFEETEDYNQHGLNEVRSQQVSRGERPFASHNYRRAPVQKSTNP
ncbi:MAG: hypothetical protein SWX82_26430, partial [Cyanobacteriota bacterium]|nr:hypothetical protein [Cyanobacteriota bacterium]